MPKKPAQDFAKDSALLVRAVTDTPVTPGENIIGDPETRRRYIEARDKELARQAARRKRS